MEAGSFWNPSPPAWAGIRPGWEFAGIISRNPSGSLSFFEYCQRALRSDHGELRRIDYYPQGAVCWTRERN